MDTADSILEFSEKNSWYQTIDLGDGNVTKGCEWCGDPVWASIKKYVPEDMTGLKVLDLGCNAGVFCVRSALRGAKCLGIDCNDWKVTDNYFAQAQLIKAFFEEKHQTSLDITYVKARMEDELKKDLGKFDYCYALACLYYTTDPDFVVGRLKDMCKNVIARIRDENRIVQLEGLFAKHGFIMKDKYRENWSERLSRPVDDFYLYHYEG